MSVSVCLSVTDVNWRIIANLGFKFRSKFTAHCRRHLNNNISHYASPLVYFFSIVFFFCLWYSAAFAVRQLPPTVSTASSSYAVWSSGLYDGCPRMKFGGVARRHETCYQILCVIRRVRLTVAGVI